MQKGSKWYKIKKEIKLFHVHLIKLYTIFNLFTQHSTSLTSFNFSLVQFTKHVL